MAGAVIDSHHKPKQPYAPLVVAILVVGTALRAYSINARALWDDEAWTAAITGRGVGWVLEQIPNDIHPPGYYLIEALWVGVAGKSDWALRFPSLLAGVALIWLVAHIARQVWGPRVALLAAALTAVCPQLVYQSQEARSYSLLALTLVATCWVYWRYLDRPAVGLGIAVAALGLLTESMHYLGIGVLIVCGLLMVARRALARPCSWAPLALIALGVPPLLWLRAQQDSLYATAVPESLLVQIVRPMLLLGTGYLEGMARFPAYAVFGIVLLGAGWGYLRRLKAPDALFAPVYAVGVLLLIWGGAVALKFPIRDSYLTTVAPGLMLFLAAGLAAVPCAHTRGALTTLALGLGIIGSYPVVNRTAHPNPDFRKAAALVAQDPADGVILVRGWGDLACYQRYNRADGSLAVYGVDPAAPSSEAKVVGRQLASLEEVTRVNGRIWQIGKASHDGRFDEVSRKLHEAGFSEIERHETDGVLCILRGLRTTP